MKDTKYFGKKAKFVVVLVPFASFQLAFNFMSSLLFDPPKKMDSST